MKEFNPIDDIENSNFVLDSGKWPNFHDAEIHRLSMWRGDMRPEDNIWIGPVIEISLELCALKNPYMVFFKFHDCDSIKLEDFNHSNQIFDLTFKFQERGTLTNGNPLPPFISVNLKQGFGASLSFKCFKVEAINCKD